MRYFDTLEKAGFRFSLSLHREDHPALSNDFWGESDDGTDNSADAKPEGAADQQQVQPQEQQQEATTEPAPEGDRSTEQTEGPAPDGGKWLDRYDDYEDAEKAYKALQADYTRVVNGLKPKNPELFREMMGDQGQQPGQYPMPQGYPQQYGPQGPQGPYQTQQVGPQYGQAPQVPNQQQIAQAAQQDLSAQQKADPESFWKKFSENPQAVLSEAVTQGVQQYAQPIAEFMTQTAVRQQVADMRGNKDRYPGFQEMESDIADYLNTNPYLAQQQNGLEVAYNAVRGIHASSVGNLMQRQTEANQAQRDQQKRRASFEGQGARTQTPQGGQEPVPEEEQAGQAIVAASRRGRLPW